MNIPLNRSMLAAIFGTGTIIPLALVTILLLMVIPIPPLILDILFTFNIALSLILLMVTVYAPRPLDFAIFPSLLLVSTLLRLSLNVASTRIVLLKGHEGPGAAGQVIQSFGNFVAGGNYTVGFVVFAILVIINFVVVTKGAGRVSEVSARFTLDAMPGKQMAIDADLSAGLVNHDQARIRRSEVAQEADFYGAMDGASKFVRGDAIAGIFILLINIIGGLIIGVTSHGLAVVDALELYGLLTIGDGLVAQLPSLLLSTGTAILVTRVSNTESIGEQFSSQVLDSTRALSITAVILTALGLVPGMPSAAFLSLALATAGIAWQSHDRQQKRQLQKAADEQPEPAERSNELNWDDIDRTDALAIEVGYKLIALLDDSQGGTLLARIKGIRKKLSRELSFLIQPVHIRDNLELPANAYRISVNGVPVAQAEVLTDRHLAINPESLLPIDGIAAKDPAFGLDALWIEASRLQEAQTLGYTVVDPATVIATHLSKIINDHCAELLGYEETQTLLDRLGEISPKLIEDLIPTSVPMIAVVKVLKNLLHEKVSIADLRTIAEILTERGSTSQNTDVLTEAVREGLSRSIVQKINGLDDELQLITLEPELERILLETVSNSERGLPSLEPELAGRLQQMVQSASQTQEGKGFSPVLAVSPELRGWMSRMLRPLVPSLHVLAFTEIPDDKRIRIALNIGSGPQALTAT